MRIHVRNDAAVPDAELARVLAAVQRQIEEDLYPWWSVWGELTTQVSEPPEAVLVLTAEPLPDNNQGQHGYDGIPVAWVYIEDPRRASSSDWWAMSLSHEVLEMLVNPRADRLVRGPDPEAPEQNVLYVEEICDPVAGRYYVQPGSDVLLADFVLPRWFTAADEPGPCTFLGTDDDPDPVRSFQLGDGGFVLLEDLDGRGRIFPSTNATRASAHLRRRGLRWR